MKKITIIGGGNLGSAIASGILNTGFILPEQLKVTKRNVSTLDHLAEKGVQISNNNQEAVDWADVIFLCIKPYHAAELLEQLRFRPNQLVVSTISGLSISDIRKYLLKDIFLCRAMPNTAIAVRQSMTCICFDTIDPQYSAFVYDLFDNLGNVIMIDESLMDAATVLGACGTAFAMRYIRANIQAGIQIGFNSKQAFSIVAQTVKGAAELLMILDAHPEREIDKVTTPKGCTIMGLNEMEHQGFSSSIIKGLVASFDKLRHISPEKQQKD